MRTSQIDAEVASASNAGIWWCNRIRTFRVLFQIGSSLLIPILLMMCLPSVCSAATTPSEYVFGRSAFPASNQGIAIAVGDFNGDGRPDFVSANSSLSPSVTILVGQPTGGFLETQTISLPQPATAGVAGDFNSDGKLDIALVTASGVVVLTGSGNGTFFSPTPFPVTGFPISVITGDFNQDGRLDLALTVAANNISTGSPGVVAVLLGNGDGTFQNEIDTAAGTGVRDLVAGDFNADGKLDVAVVNAPSFSSNTISLLIGQGNGSFSTAQNLTVAGEPTGIQAADFNKDGRLDLALSTLTNTTTGEGIVSLLLGNGDGTFQPATDVHTGAGIDSIVVTDLNHDGNPDIVVDTQLSFNGAVSVALGNGDGTFRPHREYKNGGIFGRLFAGDFNGDGKMDVALSNSFSGLLVLLGKGDGRLAGSTERRTKRIPTQIVAGDLNGDGLADVVAVNTTSTGCPAPGSTVSVYFSNANGSFQAPSTYLTGDAPVAAAIGDFNGDRSLDLAVVNICDNTVSILLNNGNGTFGSKADYPTGNSPAAIAVGDFNSDGKTDLAIANSGDDTVSILLGKGDGTFKPKVDYPTGPGPSAILAVRLTQLGKIDLITADSGTPQSFLDTGKISILRGNGNGTFQTNTEVSLGQVLMPNDVVAGDFNRDGKLDLAVVANRNAIGGVVVLNGNGDGTFVAQPQAYSTGRLSANAAVADFDNDGILDLAVTASGVGRMTLLKGRGDGSFIVKGTYGGTGQPLGIVAADFNLDNLPDVAFVNPATNSFSTYLSIPPKGADFALAAAPPTATVSSTNPVAVSYTVSVSGRGGFNQSVALGCVGAPRNTMCTVTPDEITVSGSTKQTATVTVTPSSLTTSFVVPVGTYTLTVTGTSGAVQHDATLTFMSRR